MLYIPAQVHFIGASRAYICARNSYRTNYVAFHDFRCTTYGRMGVWKCASAGDRPRIEHSIYSLVSRRNTWFYDLFYVNFSFFFVTWGQFKLRN